MVDLSSTSGRIFKLLVLFKMKGPGSFRIEMSPIPEDVQSWTGYTFVRNEHKHQTWDWMIFHIFVKTKILEFWSNLLIFVVEKKRDHTDVKCFVQSHTSHERPTHGLSMSPISQSKVTFVYYLLLFSLQAYSIENGYIQYFEKIDTMYCMYTNAIYLFFTWCYFI